MKKNKEDQPYFGWCDVRNCKNEAANGGCCWRETGYWSVCHKHADEYRNGKPQPRMKRSAIIREGCRGTDGVLAKRVKKLLAHKTMKMNCGHCQSTTASSPNEWVRKIDRCINCKLDIQQLGQWTGSGLYSFQRIIKLFPGHNSVWEKLIKEWGLFN